MAARRHRGRLVRADSSLYGRFAGGQPLLVGHHSYPGHPIAVWRLSVKGLVIAEKRAARTERRSAA
ncbi:hypothetical protein [Streptomyces rimosus]|uniref:hypothetical protein n=1 Tax=Streptomyces rimosus TaxID=1927 RepID=UPI001F37A6AD|nr:hypothetical protein [Streptomyces rimosus]